MGWEDFRSDVKMITDYFTEEYWEPILKSLGFRRYKSKIDFSWELNGIIIDFLTVPDHTRMLARFYDSEALTILSRYIDWESNDIADILAKLQLTYEAIADPGKAPLLFGTMFESVAAHILRGDDEG